MSKHGGSAYEGWVSNHAEFVEPTKGSLTTDKMGIHNGSGTLHDKVRWPSHRSPILLYKELRYDTQHMGPQCKPVLSQQVASMEADLAALHAKLRKLEGVNAV